MREAKKSDLGQKIYRGGLVQYALVKKILEFFGNFGENQMRLILMKNSMKILKIMSVLL